MNRLGFTAPFLVVAVFLFGACSTTETPPAVAATYSQEEIEYFAEVALGTEFGTASQRIRKWAGDVRIDVRGNPTEADEAALNQILNDLNTLIPDIEVRLDDNNPTTTIHFAPESEFSSLEPNYVPVNLGFFWVNWTGGGEIFRSNILITTEGITPQERAHLIREELTQSLGLMRDSNRYPDSIFFQGWTDVTRYTDLDKAVIEMLYRPEIRPNMTRAQALDVLTGLDS